MLSTAAKVLPTPLTKQYVPELVSIDLIQPNTYNPNVMPDTLFQELLKDIRTHGFVGAIIARRIYKPLPDQPVGGDQASIFDHYEIIDGEHRYRAAKHLGYTELPVITLDYEDDQAKLATFRFNHERGVFDTVKTSEFIHDLATRHTIDALARDLGMQHEEMVQYLRPSEIPASWNMPGIPALYQDENQDEPIILGYAKPQQKETLLEDLDRLGREKSLKDRVHTVRWLLGRVGEGQIHAPRPRRPESRRALKTPGSEPLSSRTKASKASRTKGKK